MSWFNEVDFVVDRLPMLERGSEGADVFFLQQRLRAAGFTIKPDGDYGPATERVVREFQLSIGLVADGIAGDKTRRLLREGVKDTKFLLQKDIEWAAAELTTTVAKVLTVNEVESRGSGFFENQRPAILYERHVMRRQLNANGFTKAQVAQFIHTYPNLVNTKTGGYKGGVAEYTRLGEAKNIHDASAYESCSWGLFQIMAYHGVRLGYASVFDFVKQMHAGERQQLEAFVLFIKDSPVLWEALIKGDWTTFARHYNGPGYAKHNPPYDVRMANAFKRHSEFFA